jgi:type IV pilus assembly protein PilE
MIMTTHHPHQATRAGSLRGQGGFTLIELMVTIAIVAVLAAIAYPSYKEYVAKSRRAEAQALLMQSAQWMERFYAENYSYSANTAGVSVNDATMFPARYSQSPASGTAAYNIAVAPTATTYTITATRAGTMAADKCGNFQITHTGVKQLETGTYSSAAGSTQVAAMQSCWR